MTMRKKIFFLPVLFMVICLTAISCLNNDNDDDIVIDEEWKALNERRFNDIDTDVYDLITSESGNGNIYWKESSVITQSDETPQQRITVAGRPEFTDTVVVRYDGWYLDKDGKEVIFDSTERISLKSDMSYRAGVSSSPNPNKQPVITPVNGITDASRPQYKSIVDGWTTLLQDMTVGEEREVVIPYTLGYGSSGYTFQPITGGAVYQIIPGYTTLWFRIKLLRIIPMSGLS